MLPHLGRHVTPKCYCLYSPCNVVALPHDQGIPFVLDRLITDLVHDKDALASPDRAAIYDKQHEVVADDVVSARAGAGSLGLPEDQRLAAAAR